MASVNGTALNDILYGASASDVIKGFAGADTLLGFAGDDMLDGGDGNDVLRGGAGNDQLIGGAGTDTASYSGASAGVTVNLGLTAAQNTGGMGNDTLSGIEWLTGSAFGDRLVGDGLANKLSGGRGNDVLSGLAGDDQLYGGAGNDRLNGGAGNDLLNGGSGEDTATYANASAAVVVRLEDGDAAFADGSDILVSIENLIGSRFDDGLLGDGGDNRINGGAGNDYIDGLGGADRLTGGSGADWFEYYHLDNGDAITDFASGSDHISLWMMQGRDFHFIGGSAFSGTAGEGRFADGQFQLDYDGDGASDMAIDIVGQLVRADIYIPSIWDY
jgi:Ca2+-binding RTX toxin-like protein